MTPEEFEWAFEMFALVARQYGVDRACGRFSEQPRYTDEDVEALRKEYCDRIQHAQTGFPPQIIAPPGRKPWYPGPLPEDRYWPALRRQLIEAGTIPAAQVDHLDEATTKVLAYTRDPSERSWSSKGLVVGYVQSGKTTNFTAVIAKAVDAGYNLVIVLSGIHNGLRTQTQERLESQLCGIHPDGWIKMTEPFHDFRKPPQTLESVLPNQADRKAVLLVVKKNAAVLRKVVAWIKASRGGLRNVKALIVDDESDQATVATPIINPLIRDLLKSLPCHTFIGYTATPFANVLIDPADDDLYPSDFILNMPRPDRYFGADMIFGRDDADDGAGPVDGYDMVRIIPDEEAAQLRPPRQGLFEPELTPMLERATLWFWLATAARRSRGDAGHSTMLVHTSMKTAVHEAFRDPLDDFRREVVAGLSSADPQLEERLAQLWAAETTKVSPEQFPGLGLQTVDYDEVRRELPAVVAATTTVLDNSRSTERLDYRNGPVTAIAIGGNTLSRGLTLEGLVVSYFIRSAKAYDTLLQMGRWFGFRVGYEDLPRIYMTKELRNWFRHLAMVEHEIRLDIDRYEEQDLTPKDFGPRIRSHPTLLATQKLGAAKLAYTSYGGRRVQTRYFRHRDGNWLERNLVAAGALLAAIDAEGIAPDRQQDEGGPVVFREVPAALVRSFLEEYESHPDSPDLNRDMLLKYIDKELGDGSLARWSVAVMAADDDALGTVTLGAHTFGRVVRSRLADGVGTDPDARADIKTLMSKEHRVVDLDIGPAAARRLPEERLMALRNEDQRLRNQGLLLLYPIDPVSAPGVSDNEAREKLDAAGEVIGMALVFPGNAKLAVQNSYIAVDLSNIEVEDPDEIDDLINGDPEDDET